MLDLFLYYYLSIYENNHTAVMWAAYDWELDMCAHFFQTLYSFPVQTGVEDKMFWSLGKKCLCPFFLWGLKRWLLLRFPLEDIWQVKVPTKVVFFFLWFATWENSLLKITSWKRVWCWQIGTMCQNSEEIVDHWLLHYPEAIELWNSIFLAFWRKLSDA